MVPPLVTAIRWPPGRPRSVPVIRSQTSRGRSPANSSLGYRPASMSSTASSTGRVSPANGAARRTVRSSSVTSQSSIAVIATICWASTSSGLRGIRSSSISPPCIRFATTVAWTRSPWYFGKITARDTSPTLCPARPVRCRPLATEGGDSTWMTRSTAPMSMPSSRLDVATTAGSRPAFSASSICARSCRETEPWWALATSAGAPADVPAWAISSAGGRAGEPGSSAACCASSAARSAASSFSRPQSRSASRREFAKTMVDLCAWIRSSTRSSTCGQIDRRRSGESPGSAGPPGSRPGARDVSRSVMSSTGTTILSSMRFSLGGAAMVTGRAPPRNPATSSGGRTVADSPIRCAGPRAAPSGPPCWRVAAGLAAAMSVPPLSASRRSSDSAR